MSYVFKKGKEAKEYVEQKNNDASKQLAKLKAGDDPILVKIVSDEEYAYYEAHSAHKVFFTTPCMKLQTGTPDLYDKASELLYQDYAARVKELKEQGMSEKDAKEDASAKQLSQQAYTLKAKGRYIMGFFSLDTGEQIVIDVTENQGENVIKSLEKYVGKKDKIAFELSKTGSGTKTTVSLMPVLDMDEDVTEKQRKTFDKLVADKVKFDDSVYGKLFTARDEKGQIEDLVKFGFDVSRLGIDPQAAASSDDVQPVEDDNPESQF